MTAKVAAATKTSYTPGMESNRKRRAIAIKILAQLKALQENEETCMDNISESLWESVAFVTAEHAATYLQDAIETLELAYDLGY